MLNYALANQAQRVEKRKKNETLAPFERIHKWNSLIHCVNIVCNQQLFYNLRSTTNKQRLGFLWCRERVRDLYLRNIRHIQFIGHWEKKKKSVTTTELRLDNSLVALLMNKIKNNLLALHLEKRNEEWEKEKSSHGINRPRSNFFFSDLLVEAYSNVTNLHAILFIFWHKF